LLAVDRIFGSGEFNEQGLGLYHWSSRTASRFTLEAPGGGGQGRDLVRNDLVGGGKEVVVPAAAFIPPGQSAPLDVQDFELSADESKLLLFTNSRRVWRRKTRGDYWLLDVVTRSLRKLGGDAASATLMFAKFSPVNEHWPANPVRAAFEHGAETLDPPLQSPRAHRTP
jgi:dipeptidyl-peptidase-4